ncbi:MAG: glutamyl-tRNA reductase [Actinobacteria bacterium]|nr:glutamyl-tRNA reductase [Actinomycetota bacterium]
MLSIYLTGINYKKAPLDIRERFSFDENECKKLLSHISGQEGIEEVVILSTCNRTEFYVVANHSSSLANGRLVHILAKYVDLQDPQIAQDYFYKSRDFKAVEHLFKVVAGLDSMVLGEDQILGQVRNAYTLAVEAKTANRFFHKIFHQSFRVGKRSRNETKISWGAASIGSVAVELAQKIFSDFDKSVLMVGAGEIAQITLMNLQKRGINRLTIANRTLSKAQKLARQFNATAIPFDELKNGIEQADMVICSTASREAIISTEMIKEIMAQRKNRPLFLIDIAVPRDIEQDVRDLYNVFLYDIDDLRSIVSKNLRKREQEIPKVMEIILEEMHDFINWYKSLDVLPTIKQLQHHFEEIRQREIKKNRKHFVQEDWEQIDKFSKSLLKKFLHSPMIRLHQCKDDSELCGKCTIKEIFGLDEYEANN